MELFEFEDDDNFLLSADEVEKMIGQGSVEVEEDSQEAVPTKTSYIPTTAPFPKQELETVAYDWFQVICSSEDLPDYIAKIPQFHFKALVARIESSLMRNGLLKWDDGRLGENKKKGIKLKK